MTRFQPFRFIYSFNNFAAAMLALGIGFSMNLSRPYWAMMTVYIVSQPMAGALRSKAVYRLVGTIAGAAVAVVLVPALVDAPVLLCLAMAAWVGGCLAVSLLDRTPRSYLLMLSGYTAVIIGFPAVSQPDAIFDIAVSRVEEISLGILCATLVHSVIFPRPVTLVLFDRFRVWLADADKWALDLLRQSSDGRFTTDRRHLAAAASEIHQLTTHLPFDNARRPETVALVQTLQDRILMLIPILSTIEDRLQALDACGPLPDPDITSVLEDIARWIEASANWREAELLSRRLDELIVMKRGKDWRALLTQSLLTRMIDFINLLAESRALAHRLEAPAYPLPRPLVVALQQARARPLHRDPGLALLSGLAAMAAILLTCLLWIGTGWNDGAVAALMAGVFCCLFATLDDPAPAMLTFSFMLLAAIPLAAVYQFAIFPAIDGFPMLAATLAPPMLIMGYFLTDARFGMMILPLFIGFAAALTIQETFAVDMAVFLNGNLAQFVGSFIAVMVTRGMRSISIEASVKRLVTQLWRDIERIAHDVSIPDLAVLASVNIDRLGLLAAKLAAVETGGPADLDILRELRMVMNVALLKSTRAEVSGITGAAMDRMLNDIGDHFGAAADGRRDEGRANRREAGLLKDIDMLLASDIGAPSTLMNLVGLRRNLFPHAAGYNAGVLS